MGFSKCIDTTLNRTELNGGYQKQKSDQREDCYFAVCLAEMRFATEQLVSDHWHLTVQWFQPRANNLSALEKPRHSGLKIGTQCLFLPLYDHKYSVPGINFNLGSQ